jgi:hypothetical protein
MKARWLMNAGSALRSWASGVRPASRSEPRARVEISSVSVKRPAVSLVKLLALAGYRVELKSDFKRLVKMPASLAKLMDEGRLSVRLGSWDGSGPAFFDEPETFAKASGRPATLLDFNVFASGQFHPSDLFFPISLHPAFLEPGTIENLAARKRPERRGMRVFFAGNLDEASYDNRRTAAVFGVRTRRRIYEIVREAFSGRGLFEPASHGEFTEALRSGDLADRIVVCDVDKAPIPRWEWFASLEAADFSLSPPGVLNPFCHNTVEAMAVGTPPILEYPDLFRPALAHGRECLAFESDEELVALLTAILGGEWDERQSAMSAAAKAYYAEGLSPAAFASWLKREASAPKRERRLYLCQNELSTALAEGARVDRRRKNVDGL